MRLPLGATLERGRFWLGRLLGQPGSFGMVYLGWDERLRRRVAIKECFPDYMVRMGADQALTARRSTDREYFVLDKAAFLQEALLLAELVHPQVVEVMDHFEERGTAYLVMKYYEGQTLDQNLRDYGGRMTVSRAVGICQALLEPLAYLHRRGYLHGDLKPANIYLARLEEGGERPILLDFGASRRLRGERSATVDSVITKGYAAPEQIEEKEQRGARSDIYALGAVLYRLLTGQVPPHSLERKLRDQLVPPQQLLPELDPRLNALMLQMLELNPERRPTDCEALKSTMEAFLWAGKPPMNSEPTTTRTPTPSAAERASSTTAGGERAAKSGGEQAPSPARQTRGHLERFVSEVDDIKQAPSPVVVQSRAELHAGARKELQIKGVAFAFRWCPPGRFLMGSPASEPDRSNDESQHEVVLSRGYWLMETVLTQRQWMAVMGTNPSHFKGEERPVEQVSWEDAQAFIRGANAVLDGGLRLPTEAEWEYACRAGTTGAYAGNLDRMGWFWDNAGRETHPVGQKEANAWGLYDMHGNVWEWCNDWYGTYPGGKTQDPTGPSKGRIRVFRGGSWGDSAGDCRSASRNGVRPAFRSRTLGFRLALGQP